ncbi:GNAT family N-acetyltransferase [Kitasatospora sp. NBC_00240]|uniref:GNAT family N-acetyltransferase n=1 Tax=Kitasatospora sp. NBC_00240 TaxID=2903567 RepID=UPI00225307D1|nr:GNAT family N-acetyltransferase [Kitasatospora sp. NBC_00240]MCX5207831.1 GNAT family N-acetyltransferase [Kitasatospora sp. NBC_00240]
MPELIAPTVRLHAAWLEARGEWGPGAHEDGFGLRRSDEVDSSAGFAAWVARLADQPVPVPGSELQQGQRQGKSGRAGAVYRWIVEDGRVHGGIALRYGPGDFVLRFGHIGYGVRPSSRRRGLAAWALGRMLDEARALGLGRLLLVCAADNIASVRTIERQGGVLEGVQETEFGTVRRYWITI